MISSVIRLFRRKRNNGFTLVEMIVSVALLAILMAGMILFITPVIRSFNDNQKNLNAENVSTCIHTYLTSNIRNSVKIVVFGNTNDEALKNNTVCATEINNMKNRCNETTSTGVKEYVLKCISFRYDDTDKRYYMYNETINTSGTGDTSDPLNAATRYNVFSEVLYKDLYFDLTLEKPLDMDKAGETPQPLRNDAMNFAVNTYSDAAHKNLVFVGSGITELRQIKKSIIAKIDVLKNGLFLYDGVSANSVSSVKTSDGTDGARNFYIYYLVRQFGTSTP